jgi:hypothetical protein
LTRGLPLVIIHTYTNTKGAGMKTVRIKTLLTQELEALLESPSNGVRDEIRIARLQKELAHPLGFDERDEMEALFAPD